MRASHELSALTIRSESDGLWKKRYGSEGGEAGLRDPGPLREEGRDSVSFCKKLLQEAKVSTTPGIAFGPNGESHLRMSFCVPLETIDRAFDRMDAYFGS